MKIDTRDNSRKIMFTTQENKTQSQINTQFISNYCTLTLI